MKEFDFSANKRGFIIEAVKRGCRLNGRGYNVIRTPVIHISPVEPGFVELEWGKTKLSVRVSAEVSRPYEDRPFEGLFSINSETSSMACTSFENGKLSDEEVLVSRLIEKAVRRSNALDLESLCIIAGEKVWHIRVDINFLNHDGGLIDASSLGVMTALHHFRKPDISISGTEVIIHSTKTHRPTPLSILHVPLCVTISFFNPQGATENIKGLSNDEISILDADKEEELARDGSLVVTLNSNREVIQISKHGGIPIDGYKLMQLAKDSIEIVETLTSLMRSCLNANSKAAFEAEKLMLLEVGASR